jgi:AraC-like DNA-binding protein
MDGARISRFPHLSWMRFACVAGETGADFAFKVHGVNHWLSCSLRRNATVRVMRSAREDRFQCPEETVRYSPSDLRRQLVIRHGEPGHVFSVLLIPAGHLRQFCEQEGIRVSEDAQGWIRHGDHVLSRAVNRLALAPTDSDENAAVGMDAVARRLILHLVQLNGGGVPDWRDDTSGFDPQTLRNLVEYIDHRLRLAPSLSDMAALVGLSPSHFAKKFRQSTGLSLCRFINRRRILRSLEDLKAESSLARISLDLGFSSQSHFTRTFSGLTGITPANYQKAVRRIVG